MALLVSREIGCHRTVSRETLGNGRPERNRTSDSPLRRRVLFLLSYGSISRARAPIRRFSRPVESTLSRAMRPSLPRREGNTVGRTSSSRRAGPRGPGGGQTPSIRAPRRATHAGHTAPDARAATSNPRRRHLSQCTARNARARWIHQSHCVNSMTGRMGAMLSPAWERSSRGGLPRLTCRANPPSRDASTDPRPQKRRRPPGFPEAASAMSS